MAEDDDSARATLRVFAIAAIALAGLALSATPIAARIDAALLDFHWVLLGKFDPLPAPDDIVIVGLDEATLRGLGNPPAPWQEPVAQALVRIAAAKPRAIALALALPERSFEGVRPGFDRMFATSLAAARHNGPFVAVIDIDARTRAAKPIYPPYLAVLEDSKLGLGILSRDVDGVTRRFSLKVPTEDGGYPTLVGRLCPALSDSCGEGLLHYALGPAFRLFALHQVANSTDPKRLEQMFRNRIVLVGDTRQHSDRVEVPVNLAGWERGGTSSPGVVVHAQALRTALLGAAPVPAARPFTLVTVTLAALIALMGRAWIALAAVLLVGTLALASATLLLRGGFYLPLGAALSTLVLAWAARAVYDLSDFQHRGCD